MLAQRVVFIPLVAWDLLFGYPQVSGVDMVFAIRGFFTLGVAIFNLLPSLRWMVQFRGLSSLRFSRRDGREYREADLLLEALTGLHSAARILPCQCDQTNQATPITSATPITASNWWKYFPRLRQFWPSFIPR